MVDDVTVSMEGRDLDKKVLYLTNKQCTMFDDTGIRRCLQALDLGSPKCVIRLMTSLFGEETYRVHTECHFESNGQYTDYQCFGSEIYMSDSFQVNKQLDLFMKTCVLPLAIQTHALILASGCNDCLLSSSLERVVLPEQSRLGKNCPFTVLSFIWTREVHYKALHGEGVAGQLAAGSTAWNSRLDAISSFMGNCPKREIQMCDVIRAASHIIVFEAFDANGEKNNKASNFFAARILDILTEKLPSIAIQTHNTYLGMATLADLGRRHIPTFFLDIRERVITMKVNSRDGEPAITQLAQETDAFPIISMEQLAKFKKLPDGSIHMSSKKELLNVVFGMIESQVKYLTKNGVRDEYDSSAIALIHSALLFASSSSGESNNVPLHSRIRELKRMEHEFGSSSTRANIPLELAAIAADFLCFRYKALQDEGKLARVENWLTDNPAGGELDYLRADGNFWFCYMYVYYSLHRYFVVL